MGSEVMHQGLITSVKGDKVKVRIGVPSDECGGCAVAAMCSKSTEVEVCESHASAFGVGDRVRLKAVVSTRSRAYLLLMCIPLLLVLLGVSVPQFLGASQTASCVTAIVLLCLWYLMLCLFRKKIDGTIVFQIIKE